MVSIAVPYNRTGISAPHRIFATFVAKIRCTELSDSEGISVLINDKEDALLYDISGRRATGPLTRGCISPNERKVLLK